MTDEKRLKQTYKMLRIGYYILCKISFATNICCNFHTLFLKTWDNVATVNKAHNYFYKFILTCSDNCLKGNLKTCMLTALNDMYIFPIFLI